ncbi:MAG: outer membrane beta-barrel protein [Crocinitomicaceae bacterium]|nr:outer membrane beta-barrel protein [Crocinitomicaceae bacterium]MDG1776758.1 outer membrane beta-barrel protein [Crocinitomicaceae bacterium]
MHIFCRAIFVVFLSLLGFSSFGQEMKVTGTVYDSTGVKPIQNVMAMAVRMKDSLLLGFDRTDASGNFELSGFTIDTFSLVLDHPQFDDKIYYMFGHKENAEINIPVVRMYSKSQEIEEVVIYANREPIFYRGDTLVYVADSFNVREGAVVEDLLKKLPGLKVDKQGKITSQGQEISQVLVDGDEFFGSDPTIATQNLNADGIETVEVYEKENDDGIGGDDEKIQVLDLKLKDSAKKGYFGRISGASDFALTPINDKLGTDPFFEGELLFNKFNGARKFSIFALGANTPRSSFGRNDMNKFGLSNEDGAGGRFWEDNTQTTSGIPQTLKAGVYFSDKIGKNKRAKINMNYSYYNTELEANTASRSQYFLADTTYYTDDSTRNYSQDQSHRFNVSFEAPLNALTTLKIKPSFTYDIGSSESNDVSAFLKENGVESLRTSIENTTESKGYRVDAMASINRKFKKKKRELELRYDLDMVNNQTDGALISDSRQYNVITDSLGVNQSKINGNATTSHYTTLTYVEPIAKRWKTEFEYLFEYGLGAQNKEAYDFENGVYSTKLNEDFSNDFETTRQQHRGSVKLIYENRKHTISAGVRLRNIDIQNENLVTEKTIGQNITNFLPNFRYQFKPSVSKRFSINYNARSAQPSITDLQPVPDNSNPNQVRLGNPDLKPTYNHYVKVNFNTWQAMSGRYLWSYAYLNVTDNAFASSTMYDNLGRAETQTVNVDGNISAGVYGGGGIPMFNRVFTIDPNVSASYNKYSNLIQGEKNITQNYELSGGLDFEFEWDSLEIFLTSDLAYNNPVSSLSTVSSTPFTTEEYGLGFEWVLPLGFTVGSEGTYTKNTQPGGGFYNTEFFVWNAEVSKEFLKTGNLKIAIIGNDILNQNVNARRQVNGNIVTDYRTTIISRYFLLKATIRFNNRKTKEKDLNGWH